MTRRILLPLAADTTDTECGACPNLDAPIDWCNPFRLRLVDKLRDSDAPGYRHARCAECIAAERGAVALQERAERAERERDARPEITPEDAASALEASGQFADPDNVMDEWAPLLDALHAHARKVRP